MRIDSANSAIYGLSSSNAGRSAAQAEERAERLLQESKRLQAEAVRTQFQADRLQLRSDDKQQASNDEQQRANQLSQDQLSVRQLSPSQNPLVSSINSTPSERPEGQTVDNDGLERSANNSQLSQQLNQERALEAPTLTAAASSERLGTILDTRV